MTRRRLVIPILDLHLHFPMQFPLVARPCEVEVPAWTAFNQALMGAANLFFNFGRRPRVTLPDAEEASVSFASVLHIPADEVWGPCGPFENIQNQMAQVESAVRRRPGWTVARTPAELLAAMEANGRCLFHCIEGGYSVGGPDNIPALARAGVAYITLAHLRFRGISACVNGLPFLNDGIFSALNPMPVRGLTETGVRVAEAMMDHGIIVDLTHMTETAMDEVIAMARIKSRPVMASHTVPRGTSSPTYLLNLSDEMMLKIRETGGVIGVIAFKHWLHDPTKPREKQDLRIMLRAIEHVRRVAGDDHVAIGSDLDGFIHPVDGLKRLRNFTALRRAILDSYPGLAEKILWRNTYRTLEAGWTVMREPKGVAYV